MLSELKLGGISVGVFKVDELQVHQGFPILETVGKVGPVKVDLLVEDVKARPLIESAAGVEAKIEMTGRTRR